MSHLEAVLAATIQDWRRSRFVWATGNCLMSVGKYAADLTGKDPCAEWLGTCDDEAAAMATLEANGGGRAILAGAMTVAGLSPVSDPIRGDVVCVQVGDAQVGGICLGDFCAFRIERGMAELRTRHLTIIGAWRL